MPSLLLYARKRILEHAVSGRACCRPYRPVHRDREHEVPGLITHVQLKRCRHSFSQQWSHHPGSSTTLFNRVFYHPGGVPQWDRRLYRCDEVIWLKPGHNMLKLFRRVYTDADIQDIIIHHNDITMTKRGN